jgi:hypothetical protein
MAQGITFGTGASMAFERNRLRIAKILGRRAPYSVMRLPTLGESSRVMFLYSS